MTRMVNGPGEARSPSSTATFAPFGSEGGASVHLMLAGVKYRCSAAWAIASACGVGTVSVIPLVAGASPVLPVWGGSSARASAAVSRVASPVAIRIRFMGVPSLVRGASLVPEYRSDGAGRRHRLARDDVHLSTALERLFANLVEEVVVTGPELLRVAQHRSGHTVQHTPDRGTFLGERAGDAAGDRRRRDLLDLVRSETLRGELAVSVDPLVDPLLEFPAHDRPRLGVDPGAVRALVVPHEVIGEQVRVRVRLTIDRMVVLDGRQDERRALPTQEFVKALVDFPEILEQLRLRPFPPGAASVEDGTGRRRAMLGDQVLVFGHAQRLAQAVGHAP